jgi:hypothetical protein
MKSWQGFLHFGAVMVAVFLCKDTIHDVLHWSTGRFPTNGLHLGVIVLLLGLSSAAIVTQHFPHVQVRNRSMVFRRCVFENRVIKNEGVLYLWRFIMG